jgi:hypothetical protein
MALGMGTLAGMACTRWSSIIIIRKPPLLLTRASMFLAKQEDPATRAMDQGVQVPQVEAADERRGRREEKRRGTLHLRMIRKPHLLYRMSI